MKLKAQARRIRVGIAALVLLGAWSAWYFLCCRGTGERDYLTEFREVFPDAEVLTTSPVGYAGHPAQQWRAPRFGRYVVFLETPCSVLGCCPERHKFPRIMVWEVTSIIPLASGQVGISNGDSRTLSESDWDRLKSQHGDLEVMLPTLQRNAPVPLFDQYWRGS